jgi:hypothetical protein
MCLCSIPEPRYNCAQLYRYLKPGGRWYVYEHVRCFHSQGIFMRTYQCECLLGISYILMASQLAHTTTRSTQLLLATHHRRLRNVPRHGHNCARGWPLEPSRSSSAAGRAVVLHHAAHHRCSHQVEVVSKQELRTEHNHHHAT